MEDQYKLMKKFAYISVCILLTAFLSGCKEKEGMVTVFYGLPESAYVTEMKAAIENKKPVVVSFTAEWCPHCRAYKPVFFDVKSLYQDKVTFINVDVDSLDGSVVSERFQVKGIPTTSFIRQDGSIFKVQVGEIEKEKLTALVDDLIGSKKKKRGEPVAPFPIEPVEVKAPPTKEKEPALQDLIKEPQEEEQEVEQPAVEETETEAPTEVETPQQDVSPDASEESNDSESQEEQSEEGTEPVPAN